MVERIRTMIASREGEITGKRHEGSFWRDGTILCHFGGNYKSI